MFDVEAFDYSRLGHFHSLYQIEHLRNDRAGLPAVGQLEGTTMLGSHQHSN